VLNQPNCFRSYSLSMQLESWSVRTIRHGYCANPDQNIPHIFFLRKIPTVDHGLGTTQVNTGGLAGNKTSWFTFYQRKNFTFYWWERKQENLAIHVGLSCIHDIGFAITAPTNRPKSLDPYRPVSQNKSW